jgi:hypothetical protein
MPYTYRVVARRAHDGWNLHVNELGTVPARSLTVAEKTARSHIVERTGHAADEVVVVVQPKLDIRLGTLVQDAQTTNTELARLTDTAAAKSRLAATELRAAGLPNVDIAAVLGVSDQRVSQLFGKNGKKD